MDRDSFVYVMRNVHDALFKMHRPPDDAEAEILTKLINAYISMIAGFHENLFNTLQDFLLSHKEVMDDEIADFYDFLTIQPDRDDQ